MDFECPNFMISNATVPSQGYRYQKNILQCLIFFCKNEACVNCETHTLLTLLRILFLGRIASISYVLPIGQNIDILNRDIRVNVTK